MAARKAKSRLTQRRFGIATRTTAAGRSKTLVPKGLQSGQKSSIKRARSSPHKKQTSVTPPTAKRTIAQAKKRVTKTRRGIQKQAARRKKSDTRKLPKLIFQKKRRVRSVVKIRAPKKITPRTIKRKKPQRLMLVFSQGEMLRLKLGRKTASTAGEYLSAVAQFLRTNDASHLKSFTDQSIRDLSRKRHIFETRPNTLYRLNAVTEPFEEVYRILA